MLRFDSTAPVKKANGSGSERVRLWMLVAALGLVLVAMRQLRQPETVEKLDRVFLGQSRVSNEATDDHVLVKQNERGTIATFEGVDSATQRNPAAISPDSDRNELADVRDNTYFRPEERDSWFGLFARLQEMRQSQLAEASLGEVTYAQLLQQPDVYRGRVVTLRGTVIREESQQPEDNELGITTYHRLWLRPQGGGQWPFVVYSRTLPADFPRGDSLRADVEVAGFFFKNWSYPYDKGLGLAPVVLANAIDWQPPPPATPRQSFAPRNLVWAVAGAVIFALVTVWWAVRGTTRRPRPARRLPDTILSPADAVAHNHDGGPAS